MLAGLAVFLVCEPLFGASIWPALQRHPLVFDALILAAMVGFVATLVRAQRRTARPVLTKLAGSRPTGFWVWGWFLISLIPIAGLFISVSQARYCRQGLFQNNDHGDKPEKLGEVLRPRASFYTTLSLAHPLTVVSVLGHNAVATLVAA